MKTQDSLANRLKNGWNAFWGRDPTRTFKSDYGPSYGMRPDKTLLTRGNDRSIISAVYNRIAMDCASIKIEHIRTDENGNFQEVIRSPLNDCLTLEANTDQTSFDFMLDAVLSMFDEGHVALLPVDTDSNPEFTDGFDIYALRTGRVVDWYPDHVKVRAYNKITAKQDEIIVPKKMVAIIQNPFYTVMNGPNSTLQRLIRTLNHIDKVNQDNASGKLDLIIQLPYSTSNPTRRNQAEKRRRDLERQLAGSKYGVAYADGTERIVQLNRAIENNMWNESKELLQQVYAQLSISENIMNGTANEQEVLYYYDHTVEPILNAISLEMKRKFLSPTARTQHQSLYYFRDPFKLVPAKDLAEIAEKFTRNEVLTSNEIRALIGFKPANDPKADQLVNSNLYQPEDGMPMDEEGMPMEGEEPMAQEEAPMDAEGSSPAPEDTPTGNDVIEIGEEIVKQMLQQ